MSVQVRTDVSSGSPLGLGFGIGSTANPGPARPSKREMTLLVYGSLLGRTDADIEDSVPHLPG